jgi:hypothetical protein
MVVNAQSSFRYRIRLALGGVASIAYGVLLIAAPLIGMPMLTWLSGGAAFHSSQLAG